MSDIVRQAWRRVLVAGAVALSTGAAAAPGTGSNVPQRLGGDQNWNAYTYTDRGSKVCYIVGKPEASTPAKMKRGRVDVLITDRPKDKSYDVVNFDVGYPFKAGATATLDIDGHAFSLFTNKEAAWTRDSATDHAVTDAFAKGERATLKAATEHGTATTDTYNLAGFTTALDAIDKACGVKP